MHKNFIARTASQAFILVCLMAFTTTAYADKPHHKKHHKGPSYNHISISPYGFNYSYQDRNFGFDIGRDFAFAPAIEPQPYVEVIPQPYLGSPVFVEEPVIEPVIATSVLTPSSAAVAFQRDAELAFMAGRYTEAQRHIDHALIEDKGNPYLLLYASQVHFANGDYRRAAFEIETAIHVLPQNEWDIVISNYPTIYGQNDYVSHMAQLEQFCNQHPLDSYAFSLRGFHFGCLGHADSARRDFEKALSVDPNNSLAKTLLDSLVAPPNPESIRSPTQVIIEAPADPGAGK